MATAALAEAPNAAEGTAQVALLCVGIACVDVVDVLEGFPEEDSEVLVKDRMRRLGGNAANTACVAQQFAGVTSALLYATAPADPNTAFVRRELQSRGVETVEVATAAEDDAGAALPSSHILLTNGNRTIMHFRRLPELPTTALQPLLEHAGDRYSWVHFEGRAVDATARALQQLQGSGCRLSLEIEKERKPNDVVKELVPLADVVVFARVFVEGRGFTNATAFLEETAAAAGRAGSVLVAAWGGEGAFGVCVGADGGVGTVFHVPVETVAEPVDTVGAGDTFNAGLIVGLARGLAPLKAVELACSAARAKCTQQGLDGIVASNAL